MDCLIPSQLYINSAQNKGYTPVFAATDVAPIMRPARPCETICMPAYFQHKKTPLILVLKWASQLSSLAT